MLRLGKKSLKFLISYVDKLFCNYLGISRQEFIPQTVIKNNKKIILRNTESYKRHSYQQSWEDFAVTSMDQLSDNAKQKIGISLSKAIAKNLVISFDKTIIIKD